MTLADSQSHSLNRQTDVDRLNPAHVRDVQRPPKPKVTSQDPAASVASRPRPIKSTSNPAGRSTRDDFESLPLREAPDRLLSNAETK